MLHIEHAAAAAAAAAAAQILHVHTPAEGTVLALINHQLQSRAIIWLTVRTACARH